MSTKRFATLDEWFGESKSETASPLTPPRKPPKRLQEHDGSPVSASPSRSPPKKKINKCIAPTNVEARLLNERDNSNSPRLDLYHSHPKNSGIGDEQAAKEGRRGCKHKTPMAPAQSSSRVVVNKTESGTPRTGSKSTGREDVRGRWPSSVPSRKTQSRIPERDDHSEKGGCAPWPAGLPNKKTRHRTRTPRKGSRSTVAGPDPVTTPRNQFHPKPQKARKSMVKSTQPVAPSCATKRSPSNRPATGEPSPTGGECRRVSKPGDLPTVARAPIYALDARLEESPSPPRRQQPVIDDQESPHMACGQGSTGTASDSGTTAALKYPIGTRFIKVCKMRCFFMV